MVVHRFLRAVSAGLTALVLSLAGPQGLVPAHGAEPIRPDAFLSSPAAQAFQQQDFDAALKGFEALLRDHPGDPLILSYMGIALDRLNFFDEAVRIYHMALESAPNDPAVLFYLGLAEYKRGRLSDAKRAFLAVAEITPDSEYGVRAREFLAAIKAHATQDTAPTLKKRWDGYLQFGVQYDDNVPAAPDTVDNRDALRLFEYFNVGFAPVATGAWHARVEANGYFSQHFDEELGGRDLDERDIQQLGAAASISRVIALGGVSVVPAVRYAFVGNYLDEEEFSFAHSVTPSIDIGWSNWAKSSLFYRADYGEFDDDGLVPTVSSRDGFTQTAGLTQHFVFGIGGRRTVLSLGYDYVDVDAEGLDFDRHRHNGLAGISVDLSRVLTLAVFGTLGWDEYPKYLATRGDRVTDHYGASAALSWSITQALGASLSYGYAKEDSNYPELDYDRNIATLVFAYGW